MLNSMASHKNNLVLLKRLLKNESLVSVLVSQLMGYQNTISISYNHKPLILVEKGISIV